MESERKISPFERFFKLLYSLLGLVMSGGRTIEWLNNRFQAINDETAPHPGLSLSDFSNYQTSDVRRWLEAPGGLRLMPYSGGHMGDAWEAWRKLWGQRHGCGSGPGAHFTSDWTVLRAGNFLPIHEILPFILGVRPKVSANVGGDDRKDFVSATISLRRQRSKFADKLQAAGLEGSFWIELIEAFLGCTWVARLNGDQEAVDSLQQLSRLWLEDGNAPVGVQDDTLVILGSPKL